MRIKFISLLCLLSLTSGCAFSVYDLPVNYEYTGSPEIAKGDNLPTIVVNKIDDARTVDNLRMIMHQQNGYGQTTSGGWQAEKNLSEIVQDALTQGVEKAGLSSSKGNRRILIDGELVDVTSNVVTGWISGTINMKVTAKLSAVDESTNKILWRDTIFGDGTSGKTSSVKTGLVKSFKSALDDLVNKFLDDDYFKQQVVE